MEIILHILKKEFTFYNNNDTNNIEVIKKLNSTTSEGKKIKIK